MDLITYSTAVDSLSLDKQLKYSRLNDNEAAYLRYKIKPRVLVNVDNIDLSSSIFGLKVSISIVHGHALS